MKIERDRKERNESAHDPNESDRRGDRFAGDPFRILEGVLDVDVSEKEILTLKTDSSVWNGSTKNQSNRREN